MTIFWILAAGLAGLAVLFVIAPMLRPDTDDLTAASAPDTTEAEANVALFRESLAELDADLATGKLDQSQYDAARQDLERGALRDLELDAATASPAAHPSPAPAATAPAATQAGGTKPQAWLPSARITFLTLAFTVPVSGLALYLGLGDREIIPRLEAAAAGAQGSGRAGAAAGHAGSGSPDGMPPLDELVTRLEQRLEQTPDDAEGWMMLGRTWFATGDTVKAESALARAYDLTPKDPQLLLAYAEVMAANNGNDLAGRPAELISEALAVEPDNVTARWLSGMAAFQRGQYNSAATAWKRVIAQLDPTSEDATELAGLINEAEVRAGIPPTAPLLLAQAPTAAATDAPDPGDDPTANAGPVNPVPTSPGPISEPPVGPEPAPATAAGETPPTSAAGDDGAAAISVAVELDPALAGRVPPETTLFVYAKAAAGPPMPLAVQRATVADLPLAVQLDDSMAMMPTMQLSSFPEVIVGARVSLSGLATPQPGDLEGETGPVSNSVAGPVMVRIDRVRP